MSTLTISKTHISGQKPRRRQLNTKVCDSKSAIFRILSFFLSFFLHYDLCSNNDNSKIVQALTLILTRNGCSSQCVASPPLSVFIASNSPWSIKAIILQHSVVAVRCEGRHFLILYTCTHVVLFRSQVPRSWSGNETSAHKAKSRVDHAHDWHALVVGKVYKHRIRKALHSAANL